jgi:hypothetical protein
MKPKQALGFAVLLIPVIAVLIGMGIAYSEWIFPTAAGAMIALIIICSYFGSKLMDDE